MLRLFIAAILIFIYNVDGFILPNKYELSRNRRQAEVTTIQPGNDNSRCNNDALEKIMLENIGDDVKQSKLKVMEASEGLLGGTFNVICAHGDFSYITSTRIYCLTGNENVKCYAFLADSSKTNDEQQKS